jgi:hypothetical protein
MQLILNVKYQIHYLYAGCHLTLFACSVVVTRLVNYGPVSVSLNILSAHVRWVVTGRGYTQTIPPHPRVKTNFSIDVGHPVNYVDS